MIWWKNLLVLVFSIVLFLKSLGSIVIAKIVFLNKQYLLVKYELNGFYDFILWNIAISQYHIYRKQMKKCFILKMRYFCLDMNGS